MTVERSRMVRFLPVAGIALVAFAVLVSLGNWQLRRLAWKEALIESVQTRPGLPPIALPAASQWTRFDVEAHLYRRVVLEGRLDSDKEAWIFTHLPDPRGAYGGPGYWILAPMALSSGGTVWVNRGFAPEGRHRPEDRGDETPAGQVTVVGLIRPDEPRNFLTPEDAPAQNIFYARNIAALSAAKAVAPPVAPFTADLVAEATPPSGLPQAGETRSRFSNNHLQYALTWYGLAAALAGVCIAAAWRSWRHGA